MKRLHFILLLFFCFSFSQKKENLIKVLENSSISSLLELRQKFLLNDEGKEQRILNYLNLNPHLTRKNVSEGNTIEIVDVINGEPIFAETLNFTGAVTIRANHLYSGGTLGLNIQGQDMTPVVWDNGAVNSSHVEMAGRIVFGDNPASIGDHASHVGGTIIASGIVNSARGVAFNANLKSFDWNSDLAEITAEATNGMLVSNHSYIISPTATAWHFGAYDERAKNIDEILYNAPYYTSVWAAGNDRNNTGLLYQNQISATGGFEIIRNQANAKNHILVGAVQGVSFYTGSSDVIMSNFSSWGPTDDGRIKPDIVAKGVSVYSTSHTSSDSYSTLQGTSMASPMITGGVTLLQQHYFNVNNAYMRSSTVKGLLTNTADEAGDDIGPDYKFGWGLVNLRKAAQLITSVSNGQSIIREENLANNSSFTLNLFATGLEPLKVTICWTDPAAPFPNNGFVNPTTKYLVNDLDLRIVRNNTVYFPWKLDRDNPSLSATRNSDNNIDVIETIQIDNPVAGNYSLTVSHKGILSGGNQVFSLIVSGINQTLSSTNFDVNSINIYPNPFEDKLTINTSDVPVSQYEIYDLQGRLVKSDQINDKTSFIIDMNDIISGIYLIQIKSDNGLSSHKIIKK